MISNNFIDGIYPQINVILPTSIFLNMNKTNTSWATLITMCEDFQNIRNKYLGYNLLNSCIKLKDYQTNKIYKFDIDSLRSSFYLWDNSDKILGEIKINEINNKPDQNFIKNFEAIIDNYNNNIIKCSECQQKINKDDVAGQYYAGVYCDKCWHNKWQNIASMDNYD